MGIIKAIVEKLKIKELFAILFIAGLCFSLIPSNIAGKMEILELRNRYQSFVSIGLIIIGSYYVLCALRKTKKVIHNKRYSARRIAIKYMKEHMSIDEKRLLIEKFYDGNDNTFNMTGYIELNDGRKAALEKMGIIYRSSSISYYTTFSYNLQPYVLEYLNQNLILGKIDIQGTQENYRFKFDLE